jgi:hypothetical protein
VTNTRGSQKPPTAIGWYIVWRKANGAELPPQLYFCVEASVAEVSCMSARPSEDEEFLPVCHANFDGALWLGPYKTRKEATTALEQVSKSR